MRACFLPEIYACVSHVRPSCTCVAYPPTALALRAGDGRVPEEGVDYFRSNVTQGEGFGPAVESAVHG